jgi:hypothetical protein
MPETPIEREAPCMTSFAPDSSFVKYLPAAVQDLSPEDALSSALRYLLLHADMNPLHGRSQGQSLTTSSLTEVTFLPMQPSRRQFLPLLHTVLCLLQSGSFYQERDAQRE